MTRQMFFSKLLIILFIITGLIAGGRSQLQVVKKNLPQPLPSTVYYPVIRVIDGDTIEVRIDGRKETVRFIGIDTPEIKDSRELVQCFGNEASQKTKNILENQAVILLPDPTQEDRDKYNRLLRYVFRQDGTHVNKLLIQEGYAHEYTYRLPYTYQSEFKEAQQNAQKNQKGLWADESCAAQSSRPTTFTCEKNKTTCSDMKNCKQATFYLNYCNIDLDGNNNGIPCQHSKCK